MQQNYLLREEGLQINALMAATAWNLKKMMEKLKEKFLQLIFRLFVPQDFYRIAAWKGTFKERLIIQVYQYNKFKKFKNMRADNEQFYTES